MPKKKKYTFIDLFAGSGGFCPMVDGMSGNMCVVACFFN